MQPRTISALIHRNLCFVVFLAAICLLVSGPVPSLAQSGRPSSLPEQASEQAEAQFEGELKVLYECDEDAARLKHLLDVGNGKRLRLEFADGQAPDLPTGSRIRARGRLQNEDTLMLADSGSVQAVSVPAGANTFGARRVMVLLVNFLDNVTQPFSAATVQSVAFDQVNRFYQESSYGQTSVTGDVYGWFTLPMNSTTCDPDLIASLADRAAADAGINVSSVLAQDVCVPENQHVQLVRPGVGWRQSV